jgi:hypothetical protein
MTSARGRRAYLGGMNLERVLIRHIDRQEIIQGLASLHKTSDARLNRDHGWAERAIVVTAHRQAVSSTCRHCEHVSGLKIRE